MRRCHHCLVDVEGDWEVCPLCGNPLLGTEKEATPSPFPDIPLTFKKHLAIKILSFISITVVLVAFLIRMIWPTKINWPLMVFFGALSMWLVVATIIRKRRNIAKGIVYQIALLSLLSIFWDYTIGWRGWSLDYAIPLLCGTAIVAMFIAVQVVKLEVRDYILYIVIASLLGMIPLLFLLFQWVDHPFPSFFSVVLSIIMLVGTVIFRGGEIFAELQKRMHL